MTAPVRRCWCGRSASWNGVECAEHDDPPPRIPELPQTADIYDYLRQKGEL